MDKSSKTIWVIVLVLLMMIGAIYVLAHLWSFVIGAVVGLLFGFYFGWSKGRQSK